MCVGYKKYDVKTIGAWRAEQNKRQGFFAFFGKILGFVLWGLILLVLVLFL